MALGLAEDVNRYVRIDLESGMDRDEYYEAWLNDLEDQDALHEEHEPYAYCLLCRKRAIWPHVFVWLSQGNRKAICEFCNAKHSVDHGKLILEGFKVLGE